MDKRQFNPLDVLERMLNTHNFRQAESLDEKFDFFEKMIRDRLEKLEKEGKVKKEVNPDGSVFYHSVKPEEVKKEEKQEPVAESNDFLMSKADFVKFVEHYRDLMNAFAKIKHIFGVDFNADSANWTFYDKVNDIIWDLIKIIFGEDNLEDICNFCFGTSNFDSAEELYDELT